MRRVVVHAHQQSVEVSSRALTAEERRLLERAAGELRAELRGWLARLPVAAQTASGLARHLGVERTTCQRLVSAVTTPGSALDLPGRLPGVQGIRQVLEADSGAGAEGERAAARGAVDRYEEAVRRLAGSRSRLIRRLGALRRGVGDAVDEVGAGEGGAEGPRDSLRSSATSAAGVSAMDVVAAVSAGGGEGARRAMFESAAALTGRWSDLWLASHIYTPHPARSDVWLEARAHGLVGHHARAGAVPLTFHVIGSGGHGSGEGGSGPAVGRFSPMLERTDDDGVPAEVLRAFSSDPAPVVRSRSMEGARSEFLVQTIDVDPEEGAASGGAGEKHRGASAGRGVDLLFGLTGLTPAQEGVEEVWGLVNFPVRRMVMDVYLHRDLARTCIPGLDVHLWRPDFAQQSGERWQTRFSESPKLELIGPPSLDGESSSNGGGVRRRGGERVARAALDAWGRYTELLDLVFDRAGAAGGEGQSVAADPSAYVGFRCDVRYPIWRAGYRMTFDFGG